MNRGFGQRGEAAVGGYDLFDHTLMSLYAAVLDDALWPAASRLIDAAST